MPVHLVNKREAALILSVSPRTIEKWVFERRIPFTRVGGRCVRFDPEELLRWAKSNRVPVGGSSQ